jgi:hypothetical protein
MTTPWQSLPRIKTMLAGAEKLGALVPVDVTELLGAVAHLRRAAADLPEPGTVARKGLDTITSRSDAIALIDEVLDAKTRAESAGEVTRLAEREVEVRVLARLRAGGGLDEILDSLRPVLGDALDAFANYRRLVPEGAAASELLELGPDVAAAWREGKRVAATLGAILNWLQEVVMVVQPFAAADTTEVPLPAQMAAFLVPPGAPLAQVSQALIAPKVTSDDPVGNRRALGDIRINDLATARVVVTAYAEAGAADLGAPDDPDRIVASGGIFEPTPFAEM